MDTTTKGNNILS